MEGQGQALAMPRILAQRVEASGVCVYEKFTLRKLFHESFKSKIHIKKFYT